MRYFTDQRQSPLYISVARWDPGPSASIRNWVVEAREVAGTIMYPNCNEKVEVKVEQKKDAKVL